jgi:hypothetical protein
MAGNCDLSVVSVVVLQGPGVPAGALRLRDPSIAPPLDLGADHEPGQAARDVCGYDKRDTLLGAGALDKRANALALGRGHASPS